MRKALIVFSAMCVMWLSSVSAAVISTNTNLDVLETLIFYEDGGYDLNYTVTNNTQEDIMFFAIGVDLDYLGNAYGPLAYADFAHGWDAWLAEDDGDTDNSNEAIENLISSLTETFNFSNVNNELETIFNGYDTIYVAMMYYSPHSLPITPGMVNSNFGITSQNGEANLASPVIFVTSDSTGSNYNIYKNESGHNNGPTDVVPEPISVALLGIGLFGVGLRRKR